MRLQLTRASDYGVRAMSLLARSPDETLSSTRVAQSTGIPGHFVVTVMTKLVRAGLVDAAVGRSGGYRLRVPAEEVSVLRIVEAFEGLDRRTQCALSNRPCRPAVPCALHNSLVQATDAFCGELAAVTLRELIAEEASGRPA